jgi:hypothetical protein
MLRMAAWERLLAALAGHSEYPVSMVAPGHPTRLATSSICPPAALLAVGYALEKFMTRTTRSTFHPLVAALCLPVALLCVQGAHAAPLGDGGNAAELDMLGAPTSYADPYGTPVNGKGGQRGPIANAQTVQGSTPTDKLLAKQDGIEGVQAGRVQLQPLARNRNAKAMQTPDGAAAALYQQPVGGKPVAAAKAKEIYKSPY